MDAGNPSDWEHLANAVRGGVAGIQNVLALIRSMRKSGVPAPETEQDLAAALDEVERSLQLAEANPLRGSRLHPMQVCLPAHCHAHRWVHESWTEYGRGRFRMPEVSAEHSEPLHICPHRPCLGRAPR